MFSYICIWNKLCCTLAHSIAHPPAFLTRVCTSLYKHTYKSDGCQKVLLLSEHKYSSDTYWWWWCWWWDLGNRMYNVCCIRRQRIKHFSIFTIFFCIMVPHRLLCSLATRVIRTIRISGLMETKTIYVYMGIKNKIL